MSGFSKGKKEFLLRVILRQRYELVLAARSRQYFLKNSAGGTIGKGYLPFKCTR
jgi:hypothetical protein